MPRIFSLAHLTLLSLTPPELVDVAAGAGYAFAGLRLLPLVAGRIAYPLMDDPILLRETQARMKQTGVAVLDLEIAHLDEGFDVRKLLSFLEVGATLGAQSVLVIAEDRDLARLAQSFAALCEAGRYESSNFFGIAGADT